MSTVSMEEYLTQLKPNRDGIYTLPADKFKTLLKKYSEMKKEINKCVEIKREYDILKQDKDHVKSQYFKIIELENELVIVRQENDKLTKISQDTLKVAQSAVQELQRLRAKNAI